MLKWRLVDTRLCFCHVQNSRGLKGCKGPKDGRGFYGKEIGFNRLLADNASRWGSQHAEIDALFLYLRRIPKLKKRHTVDLLVIRCRTINGKSELVESCPCYYCMKELNRWGRKMNLKIGFVIFSTKHGHLQKEPFSKLVQTATHISSGRRYWQTWRRGKIV